MIILDKRKSRLDNILKFLKKIHKGVYLLAILIVIAIPLYYRMLTMPEPTLEDQMKEYSKNVKAPEMMIDIKFENFQKLLFERKKALRSGGNSDWNMNVKFAEVPAKIWFGGKEYRAEISLKGSRKVHYSDSTFMSYQVKLKDGETIMGMNKFSLHDPKTRNYIYEWMFHEILKKEGFIALKYDFIQISINGGPLKVYAIEERIDKILIERYGYVDGPVFKLADDTDSSFFNTVEVFDSKRYNSDEMKKITDKAYVLAKGFQEGRYRLDKFVNTDMLAKYFALCDVFMYFHGSLVKSIRFYYNPVTGIFEPIGFDGHCGPSWPHFINSEIMQRLDYVIKYLPAINMFQEVIFFNEENYDRDFLTMYAKYLKKYSSFEYLDNFFADVSVQLTEKMAVIYKNHPLFEDHFNTFGPKEFRFSKAHVTMRSKYIRELLNYGNDLSRTRVSSKIEKNNYGKKNIELDISNNFSLSLDLISMIINDSLKYFPSGLDFILTNKYAHVRNYKKYNFTGISALPERISSAKLCFKIAGTDKLLYNDIEFYTDKLNIVMDDIIRRGDNLDYHLDILEINEKSKEITFRTGKLTIDRYLKIPAGYRVIIEKGTEINLKDSAFILSYSPITLNGTADDPVKITSDRTGGIAVFDCDSASIMKNAKFSGLSYPRSEEWKLTGAVTFYRSPAIIENCEFSGNSSEDYLNIKMSGFKITGSRFKNVSSDAFDSDFSSGEISDTVFEELKNDAVDVSGSRVLCNNIEVVNAGDKAFSSGEGSELKVTKSRITGTEIGFAAKDNSMIECSEIEMNYCKLGFAAYQKKSEYGPGVITAEKVKHNVLKKEYLVEKGSSLRLNGKVIDGDVEDVKEEYLYGKEFGSPSIR